MALNKVKIEIAGSRYTIATEEPPAHVLEVARLLEEQMQTLTRHNPNLSIYDGMVLCALNAMDEKRKAEEDCDKLRQQITGYISDAARAQSEVEELKREIAKLKK